VTTIETNRATDLDRLCVDTIRVLAVDAVEQANSGHPGTPMALAPIGYVLYTRIMRHSPEHPDFALAQEHTPTAIVLTRTATPATPAR
jgi:transketolase N-terminal domain/subunit